MSRSRRTSGLDQLGPTRYWKMDEALKKYLNPHPQSITARVNSSKVRRTVKITLSDHLMSSDEIKVNTRRLPATIETTRVAVSYLHWEYFKITMERILRT